MTPTAAARRTRLRFAPANQRRFSSCSILERVSGESGLNFQRAIRIIAGFFMVVAGVAGWLLPVIPGWALFVPGLILLSREFHWARRLLRWLRNRFRKEPALQQGDPPQE